jgi:hypothetical protein
MYTLKVESVNNEFIRAVQALIQENKLWAYQMEMGLYSTTVSVSTMSIREMKRLVDLLESEQFMEEDI